MIDETQQVEEIDEDDSFELAAQDRDKRFNRAPEQTPEPEKAAPAPEPETPAAETTEPANPDYSALPEDVRKKLEQFDRVQADKAKLEQDFKALHNRLAPTQRELDRLRSQPRAEPKPAPRPTIELEAWLKNQPEEQRAYFDEFPSEARSAFNIAKNLAETMISDRLGQIESESKSNIAQLQRRMEVSALQSQHPDWNKYGMRQENGRFVPATREAADYWTWVGQQDGTVQAAAQSDYADDISRVLSLYKFERDDGDYKSAVDSDDFKVWVGAVPRQVSALRFSNDIEDRKFMLSQFMRDRDEAIRSMESENPDARKAKALAEKRQQQAQRVAPSIRGSAAPASAAAGDEDAGLEAAHQLRQQRLNRR